MDAKNGEEDGLNTTETLRARLERIENALQRVTEERDRAREMQHVLETILDRLPFSVFWKGTDLQYQWCNRRFAEDAGLSSPAEVVGRKDTEMPWREQAPLYNADDMLVMRSNHKKENYEEPQDHSSGRRIWLRTTKVALHNTTGEVVGVLGLYEDITEQKEAQAEQLRLREAIIAAQEGVLRELSAPLIPIGDGVIALVIIGAVDAARGARILETLLSWITAQEAKVAIIDVTGVRKLGPEAARAIVQAAVATRLLGAQTVLTGISPEIARSLIAMQQDLSAIVTLGNLKAGIEFALRQAR